MLQGTKLQSNEFCKNVQLQTKFRHQSIENLFCLKVWGVDG